MFSGVVASDNSSCANNTLGYVHLLLEFPVPIFVYLASSKPWAAVTSLDTGARATARPWRVRAENRSYSTEG
eukprot:COSAG02_NODE_172_length_31318_cov_18.709568_2_plen_72_part_00